jgi:hypothetical protein
VTSFNGKVVLDSNDIVAPNPQITNALQIQLIQNRKASTVLPQESHETTLAQHTGSLLRCLVPNHDSMDALAKRLDGLDEIGIFVQKG